MCLGRCHLNATIRIAITLYVQYVLSNLGGHIWNSTTWGPGPNSKVEVHRENSWRSLGESICGPRALKGRSPFVGRTPISPISEGEGIPDKISNSFGRSQVVKDDRVVRMVSLACGKQSTFQTGTHSDFT